MLSRLQGKVDVYRELILIARNHGLRLAVVCLAILSLQPLASSAAADDRRVFILDGGGRLTCLALEDGKRLWELELEQDFYASPAVIGDRLLVVSRKGRVTLLEAAATADTATSLGTLDLGDAGGSSPAFAAGCALVRCDKTLFCLEPTTAAAGVAAAATPAKGAQP